jgi:heat shock protein HslJ
MNTQSIGRWPLFALLGASLAITACGAHGPHALAGSSLPAPAASGGTAQDASALAGTWKAVSLAPAGASVVTIGEPERFTAEFRDGRLSLLADCNRCSGGYTAAAGTLSTTPLACTRAYCASAPLDTQFTALVSSATAWTVSADRLELASPAGVARLRR